MSGSVQYQSSPLEDLFIFSGLTPNVKTQIPKTLKEDSVGWNKEKANLEKSFNDHKASLKFTYDEYLNLVEKHLPDISDSKYQSSVREKISNKVIELKKEQENLKSEKNKN